MVLEVVMMVMGICPADLVTIVTYPDYTMDSRVHSSSRKDFSTISCYKKLGSSVTVFVMPITIMPISSSIPSVSQPRQSLYSFLIIRLCIC